MAVIRILGFMLLLAVAPPGLGDDARGPNAVLLVAKPGLPDPNFSDAVVLVTRSGHAGPVGVIVNRPTATPLAQAFPEAGKLRQRGDKLHFGGPVNRMQVVFVFRAPTRPEDAAELLEGVYMSSDSELLQKLLERDDPVDGLRVFAGYAAWAPGQLEAEVERGDWRLARAESWAIFHRKPETLWPELDRRVSATRVRHANP